MFINKMGMEHLLEWKSCQDYGFVNEFAKCVVDGCSEGENSDVGAKLFCQLFKENHNIEETFSTLTSMFQDFDSIKHHLLFTILFVTEDEENFYVQAAGDGIIVKQTHDNEIDYEVIEQNNSPSYYAYNYIPPEYLKMYKEGVEITTHTFSKSNYKKIGVATDGLHYLLNSPYRSEFETYLIQGKENRIKLLLNKIHRASMLHHLQNKTFPEPIVLKDDITIAF